MKIFLSNRSRDPIYQQIKLQIKEAIFAGDLREGDPLPSIRQLARDLRISVITTTRAYSDLAEEGFIESVQGRGFFVLPGNEELARESVLHKVEEDLAKALAAARSAGISRQEIEKMLGALLSEEEDG